MKPYHKNPRQITSKQIKDLGAWLSELGDLSGIVHDLNTDEIIGGNQRGRVFDVNKCEVELVDGPHEPDEQGTVAHGFIVWNGHRYAYRQVRWDEKQAEKANIVANKAGGGWDFDTLADQFEVSDLIEWGFDAAELGIDLGGGDDNDAEPQIDRAEELREQWGVEPGQLWRLPSRTPGQEHRLICGDCTDAAAVGMVMEGELAQMIFTDPPYGVNYDGGLNERKREKLTGDESGAMYGRFLPVAVRYCNRGAPMYIWFAASVGKPVFDAVAAIGYEVRAMIIWNKLKAHYGNYMAQYMQKHEPCLYIVSGESSWIGPTNEVTVWDVEQASRNENHPTEKPLELAQRAIRNHDAPIVADFFLGSGTTLIAAENLSRQCRAVEISPAYVAVALQRYVDAFGIEPELVG